MQKCSRIDLVLEFIYRGIYPSEKWAACKPTEALYRVRVDLVVHLRNEFLVDSQGRWGYESISRIR